MIISGVVVSFLEEHISSLLNYTPLLIVAQMESIDEDNM